MVSLLVYRLVERPALRLKRRYRDVAVVVPLTG